MSELVWRLRHADEFFWEPIMKWWHRNRQMRTERNYWQAQVEEYERLYVQVAEVYDTLSGGQLSKPEVSAATAIDVIEEEVHRNCPRDRSITK